MWFPETIHSMFRHPFQTKNNTNYSLDLSLHEFVAELDAHLVVNGELFRLHEHLKTIFFS